MLYVKIRGALYNLDDQVQDAIAHLVKCYQPRMTPEKFLKGLESHVPNGTEGYLSPNTSLESLAALLEILRNDYPAVEKPLNLIQERKPIFLGETPAASSAPEQPQAHPLAKKPNPPPSSGKEPAKPPRLHFVFLCVKDHELDEVRQVLKRAFCTEQPVQREPEAHIDALYSQEDFEKDGDDLKIKISLVSFQAGAQGPVATVSRMSQIVQAFEAKGNRHIRFGMVGICGGRKLGEVFIGLKAEAPETGTVRGTADGDYSATEHKREHLDLTSKCPGGAQFAREQDKPPQDNKEKHVTDGVFLSYTGVREDCSVLIGDRKKACVDMEAFAFFKTLLELRIDDQVLPVIKAVSDVGREDWGDEHNKAFMRRQGWTEGQSHDTARKLCRQEAAKRAAHVMVRLIDHLTGQK